MKISVRGLLAVGLLATSITASGSPITYEFSGAIDMIDDWHSLLGDSELKLGASFTGTGTYDPDTSPVSTEVDVAGGTTSRYQSETFAVSVVVSGTANFESDTATGQVWDDWGAFGGDSFAVSSLSPRVFDAPDLGGRTEIEFQLIDFFGTAFSTSTSLPSSLDMADFHGLWINLASFDCVVCEWPYESYRVSGSLTSLELRPPAVPEPSTLALLSMGLLGIGLSRRTRAYRTGSSEKEGSLWHLWQRDF